MTPRAGPADAACPGEADVAGFAGGVLMDGQQARHAAAAFEFAANQMARALGGDHQHIDVLRRDDRLEMDVEAVRGAEGFAGFQMRGDALVINLGLHFIGQRDDDQIGRLDGVFDAHRVEAVLDGQPAIGAVLAIGDDDLDAAVAEVQAVGVPLRAEAEDGDGLALQGVERGIFFVDHFQWLGHRKLS